MNDDIEIIRRKARAFDWLCERVSMATWDGGDEGVFLYEYNNPLEAVEEKMREHAESVRKLNLAEEIERKLKDKGEGGPVQ